MESTEASRRALQNTNDPCTALNPAEACRENAGALCVRRLKLTSIMTLHALGLGQRHLPQSVLKCSCVDDRIAVIQKSACGVLQEGGYDRAVDNLISIAHSCFHITCM